MRFLRISTPYREYLKRFYAERPGLSAQGYAEQQQALLADSFQQVGSYGFYLTALGYECEEIMANAVPLQRAWCREHGVTWREQDYDLYATLARAARFQPDIVLLANARRFSKPWIKALRAACPKLRLVLGWWGVDVDKVERFSGLDVVVTCNKDLAAEMRRKGASVEILPFAFDKRILDCIELNKPPAMGVSFVGSVERANGFHARRARLLEQISEKFEIQVFTENRADSWVGLAGGEIAFKVCQALRMAHVSERLIQDMPLVGKAARWRSAPQANGSHPLWKRVQPPMFGLRYFQTLRDSLTTLNVHPECAGQAASNSRLFEVSGVGSCLLTDWKRDLDEFFELDQEVIPFKTDAECLEKLEWLASHHAERDEIAKAGQKRTLRQHTFSQLAERLDQLIQRNT
jgi:hypothetical protein